MIILSKVFLAGVVVVGVAGSIAGLTNPGAAGGALSKATQVVVAEAETADQRASQPSSANAERATDSERSASTGLAVYSQGALVCPAGSCDWTAMFRMAR